MNTEVLEAMPIGRYQGHIAKGFITPQILDQLIVMPELLAGPGVVRLSNGPDYVVKLNTPHEMGVHVITVKVFRRQSRLKDGYDLKHKSKAERSYRAAMYLKRHDVGTPQPVAWLDRWEDKRLVESYFISLFEPAVCFRDALAHIYHHERDNAALMDLINAVAPAITALHKANFVHGDMGNQNILIPRRSDGTWGKPQFIDLNRSRMPMRELTVDERAFDLSRIALPGGYLKIFKNIYCQHQDVPPELDKREQTYRRHFEWHRRSRKYRHPLRFLRYGHQKPTHPTYPSPKDLWLWDEKTAQPMIALGRKEKHLYRSLSYTLSMAWHSLCAALPIYRRYKQLLAQSYQQPVAMKGRIGMAIHPKADYLAHELPLLESLGKPAVLVRFCHHETPEDWARAISTVRSLHEQGTPVFAAILQDRNAVRFPSLWEHFLTFVVTAIADYVTHIEITHASNRAKWGIWSAREYAQLLAPALALQERFPQIQLAGPACIDFEYHPVIAALKTIPLGRKLAALSHLLYVDRRGAPESTQGKHYSTLEKCALLKAVACWSDRCEDKVIVSEVNWPLQYTGVYSPIGCPYVTPQWRRTEPGETEEVYANYMLRYLVIAICSGHVEQVYWWRLSAHGYGLVDDLENFRLRPAFYALAFFMKHLGEATFMRKWPTPSAIYALEFMRDDRRILMLWTTELTPVHLDTAITCEITQVVDRNGHSIASTATHLHQLTLTGAPLYVELAGKSNPQQ